MRRPFTEDGVDYVYIPCVRCNEKMAVASAALLVADLKVWPVCGQCWNELDALDSAQGPTTVPAEPEAGKDTA